MITDTATLFCAKRVERQIFDVDHFVVRLTLSNTRMRNRQYAKRWCASCRVVLFFFFLACGNAVEKMCVIVTQLTLSRYCNSLRGRRVLLLGEMQLNTRLKGPAGQEHVCCKFLLRCSFIVPTCLCLYMKQEIKVTLLTAVVISCHRTCLFVW